MDAIYLDHAATTPLRPEVLQGMLPWMSENYGNPSSVHARGRKSRHAIESARERIADLAGLDAGDVIFTSGGTESNNTAIGSAPGGIVTCSAEHDAVLAPSRVQEGRGRNVHVVQPSSGGACSMTALAEWAKPGDLLSLMHVNNETGAVNDLTGAPEACLVHSDLVQSAAWYKLKDITALCDYATLSGHKIGGPKGTGVLLVRKGAALEPLLRGGGQERDRRSGTENVAGIVGMAEALALAQSECAFVAPKVRLLMERLWAGLSDGLGDRLVRITPQDAAPHILQVLTLDAYGNGLDGEMLILGLDMEGVHVSAGSACSSGSLRRSHVLQAMGIPENESRGVIRFSLGRHTTPEEIDQAVERSVHVIQRMVQASR